MGISERTELLFGKEAVRRFEQTSVLILGIGGVGSNCAISLARSGIGRLVLVDFDKVSETNINRQAIAFHSSIGQLKTHIAKTVIAEINPNAEVIEINEKILPEDIDSMLYKAGDVDFVCDCSDTITTKVKLAQVCEQRGISYVAAMGSGNKFDPSMIRFSDIYDTRVCPVCKAVRKLARKEGLSKMRVLYSPEETIPMQAESEFARLERRNVGTVAYYPAIMGHLLASDVLRSLC